MYVRSTTPLEVCQTSFTDANEETCKPYVPKGTREAYQATPWNEFANIEEMDYTGINETEMPDDTFKKVSIK